MPEIIIDAGTLQFSGEDLTATGLLVPFGVPARSNIGVFTFAAGDIEIPEDMTGVALNSEHRREDVVGGISAAHEQTEGVIGTFRFSKTVAGRQAYADAKSGKRKNLSAEIAGVRIQDGKALPGGRLFAAAVVEKPAFAGATLLAAEDTEPVEPERADADAAHPAVSLPTLPEDITVVTPEGDSALYTPEAAPAEDNPEGVTMTASAVAAVAHVPATVVPTTLLASAPGPLERAYDLGTVFGAMANVKGGMSDADSETLLAALSDIKVEAAGGLTGANSGVLQPAWVGRLWQGKRYVRKYIDLASHFYGGIQLGGRKGFKLAQGTALVTAWGGNKSEIGSGTATTSVYGSTRRAYGYAADVAREWYDLDGGGEVLQAFFEGVVDSYAKITDDDALKDIFTAASKTAVALDRLVAPGIYPAEFPAAMGMLIDGIEAVSDAGGDPSFAVVNPVAWRQLLLTPKDLVPEFIEFDVTIGTGEGRADKVTVRKAAQSFFTGTAPADPQVLVGEKPAIEFREQGETPIQIDALDVAKGGVDKAVIGYLETFLVRPEGLVLIGTKP